VTYVSKKSLKKVKFIVDFFYICDILISVMRDNIKSFGGALLRQAQMKEWKAIPEAERPTWEQFKRGLKKKPKK
jgi:hypothetical protein|tara:strand:+ start:406 stop:627 length:222 start_codon:yes stop_codon:yes gene_type:complete